MASCLNTFLKIHHEKNESLNHINFSIPQENINEVIWKIPYAPPKLNKDVEYSKDIEFAYISP